MKTTILAVLLALAWLGARAEPACAQTPKVNDEPGKAGEWGFRPINGGTVFRTPPPFSWRPQAGARTYSLEVSRDPEFKDIAYRALSVRFNVHCPNEVFPPGEYWWRYRHLDAKAQLSEWSVTRRFVVPPEAAAFPVPGRKELVSRIPAAHPRVFLRPENLDGIRQAALGPRKAEFAALVAVCEKLRKAPPATAEPPTYPPGVVSGGEEWRKIWWGNRTYTIRALDAAATLAFVSLVNGNEEFGSLAKRLLADTAAWDPRGATGYRYNDEAAMPYAYHFSRAYTFLHDRLTEAERKKCREVMAIRGGEMYRHLCPRHFWWPYSSHSNRAWHFLGEVGIAFMGEIPEAESWFWFAMNVFANTYPVWSDPAGGWHEGVNYWRSYVGRFTWWADVMKSATGIDAYGLPYFSRAGDYAMYHLPPGTKGGGFGDLSAHITPRHVRELMTVLSQQARNPYWQWYVDAMGGPKAPVHYISYLRAGQKPVEPKSPAGLPVARCFPGTGVAILNRDLTAAANNIQVIFKSSPMGTQSHGYESQNAFLLYAFGERLFIRSGRRDSYGSRHHRLWMWQTKSVNSITVSEQGQMAHSSTARGEITDFFTSDHLDYVEGEATKAYAKDVTMFRRGILFVKPDLIVIHDRLVTEKPESFEWHLHSPVPMKREGNAVRVVSGPASCVVRFLVPRGLEYSLTDKFAAPPRPRIKLVEHHLTAKVGARSDRVAFVTVFRPHRTGEAEPPTPQIEPVPGGYLLTAATGDGKTVVLLRDSGTAPLVGAGLRASGHIAAARYDKDGNPLMTFAGVGSTVTKVR